MPDRLGSCSNGAQRLIDVGAKHSKVPQSVPFPVAVSVCVCVCVCVCLCWCSLTAHSARPKSITVVPKKSKQAGAQRWAEKGSEEGKSGKKLAANCWAAFDCCSLLNGFRHCATGAEGKTDGEGGEGGVGRKQAERHKRSSDIAFVSMNFVNNF